MSRYRIEVTCSALKQLTTLPKNEQGRLAEAIDALADDPRPPGCVKLKGRKEAIYRIRIGAYSKPSDLKHGGAMKSRKYTSPLVASALVLSLGLTLLAGCDLFGSNAEGRVKVLLTDNPLEDMQSAVVTVERVELLAGDDEASAIVLAASPQEYDLLTLQNGVTAPLADVEVPEGRYRQLRLIFGEQARVTNQDETQETLTGPSGTQTGIKILLPEFEISEDGDEIEVTVDFDVEQSFVKPGATEGYLFKPVLKAQSVRVKDADVALEETGRQLSKRLSRLSASHTPACSLLQAETVRKLGKPRCPLWREAFLHLDRPFGCRPFYFSTSCFLNCPRFSI